VIFYSNGYEHWIWDDTNYPPRAVQGFYKKTELELAVQRRSTRKALATAEIDSGIVERYYQTRGIRRIAEAFERDRVRKALVVMATGAGKTRTVIALANLLMRCNWAKRVLFLADRIALVNQAVNAFKRHLPDASPVNLVTEKDGEGRVFVSTYPTMMGLIDETRDGQRRFGVGHFDLVIIDEAHRSVFQKYRAIFDYFDALLVGLTATPKDEVDQTHTASSISRTACRPTATRWMKRCATASSFRRKRCRYRSSFSARASGTTICRKRTRTDGTRWSGTTMGTCPTVLKQKPSTSGC
jgi:type I restriction enzyme R subunit